MEKYIHQKPFSPLSPEIEERSSPGGVHLVGVLPDEDPEVHQRCRADLALHQHVPLRHVPGPGPQHQHRGRDQQGQGGPQLPRHEALDVGPAPDIVAPGGTVAVIKVHLNSVNIRLQS